MGRKPIILPLVAAVIACAAMWCFAHAFMFVYLWGIVPPSKWPVGLRGIFIVLSLWVAYEAWKDTRRGA